MRGLRRERDRLDEPVGEPPPRLVERGRVRRLEHELDRDGMGRDDRHAFAAIARSTLSSTLDQPLEVTLGHRATVLRAAHDLHGLAL